MTVFHSYKIDQIGTSSVRFSTMELGVGNIAYNGETPVWGLTLMKGLQNKSYLLVTSPTALTEQAEEKETGDVSGIGLMQVCGIGSTLTLLFSP